ncbi:type I-F CRISPR-associated helicase Cas3f [Ignatzschineria cameli]|uniref:Type I-F CRISPR-associated helicase Cas3 n=1 Tax=Ignatzschineria cameli TaxID=2182793 RepID=A0A2U2AT87_9GAMM|nr:type I-F CRISPR-associated helicase Cas3f [Ignatzschineria cameli]PWD87963.1 type I-F CRISPR-associated helicase Cas3 [Ignatzschineria cameli]PWD90537.1 type I-F CRISPR-associated helicase Cas3 [Ignatzschineria cameli]PWD92421.1 type I-F CRISPR-associated helicase Cas3 [Ignatzschineria cameli]PWD93214.1 type I-F CRISPR-associated helicase Cas3 [Ignatzschineria cameli]
MNVLLISECSGKALNETRKILDQFAERTGRRTWQTAMTMEGLKTVHRLLRKTARKNSAIACFWIRSKNHTELLWTVGRPYTFNERGRVPTNRTKRRVNPQDEIQWRDGRTIEIVATLAALLHDLGKATIGFQEKLRPGGQAIDPYRHEWLSLQLFLLIIKDCQTDLEALERLAHFEWDDELFRELEEQNFDHVTIPDQPLIQLLSWLIVSHHKLPLASVEERGKKQNIWITRKKFFAELRAMKGWVRNSAENDLKFWHILTDPERVTPELTKQFKGWSDALKYWASQALLLSLYERGQGLLSPFILYLSRTTLILADHTYSSVRSSLGLRFFEQVGDQYLYRALPLIANTFSRENQEPNQTLARHLTGVAGQASNFARKLPFLRQELPFLKEKPLLMKSRTPKHLTKFIWQDSATQLARRLNLQSETEGFFGINMASTGHGKTLGNVKIMNSLQSEQRRSRLTIALGLRVLTLQTGEKLKEDLTLSDYEIATLVGGVGVSELYALKAKESQQMASNNSEHTSLQIDEDDSQMSQVEAQYANQGSESLTALVEGDVLGGYDTALTEEDLGVAISDQKAQKLLYSPIVATTIDHLIPATETMRGGKHIVPILRLLTSDLILDEVDDFSPEDLYAVTRLIYLAGVLGSRIMLSSATLAPDLIAGLFEAYSQGYRLWQKQNLADTSDENGKVLVAWFDEFKCESTVIDVALIESDLEDELKEYELNVEKSETFNIDHTRVQFMEHHNDFVSSRVRALESMRLARPMRRGELIPFEFSPKTCSANSEDYQQLAASLLPSIIEMHHNNSEPIPEWLQTQVLKAQRIIELPDRENILLKPMDLSCGVLRIANIRHILSLTRAFFELSLPKDTHLHIVPYHARQLLLLRSQLEKILDRLFNRKVPEQLFMQPEIKEALIAHPAQHHIFLIIASPVIEVGRDIDLNWAISEPSAMSSLIQLAGRIMRHRELGQLYQSIIPSTSSKKGKTENPIEKIDNLPTNVGVLDRNLRSCFSNTKIAYEKPGYENAQYRLIEHQGDNSYQSLFREVELSVIDSIPRIMKIEAEGESMVAEDRTAPRRRRRSARNQDNIIKCRYLSDLEHTVLRAWYFPKKDGKPTENLMNIFWNPRYAVHLRADLQAETPFRKSYGSDRRYIYFPFSDIRKISDIEDADFKFIAYESLQEFYQEGEDRDLVSHEQLVSSKNSLEITRENSQVSRWLELDVKQEFAKICRQIKKKSYRSSAINFLTIELDQTKQFDFHPWLGFYHRGRV